MTASACLTCTKTTEPDGTVPICDHANTRTALSKHFWFSEDQSEKGILCQGCWTKITDFHTFYCEIERVHELPNQLLEVKTELILPEKSPESSDNDDDADDDSVGCDDDDEDPTFVPKKEEKSDEESPVSDDNDPDFKGKASKAKAVKKKPPTRRSRAEKPKSEPEGDDSAAEEVEKKTPTRRRKAVKAKRETEGGDSEGEESEKKNKIRRKRKPPLDPEQILKDDEIIAKHVNLECDTCHEKQDSFQDMQKHSLKEHSKPAYVFCCDLRFKMRPRLMDHIHFHLNPDQFKCDVCSKQFHNSEGLKRHKSNTHDVEGAEKVLQCSMCPKTFSRQKMLNIHEKYHRKLDSKEWHCAICDRYFAYDSMLQLHNRAVHTTDYKYVCHVCAKGFHYHSSYKDHVATHDETTKKEKVPDERVQCSICSIWVYKKGLRKHVLQHTGAKTCNICGQECKNEMTLRYHKTQHRKQAVNCSVCGKAFKRQMMLKEHMASHTGQALYQCDFCDKTFNSNANRASHRKKMHPKEWLEDKLAKNPHKQHEPDPQLAQYMQDNFQEMGS